MKRRIVFKFRDDLYLPYYPNLYHKLRTPFGYQRQLRQFYGRVPQKFGLAHKRQIVAFSNLLFTITREYAQKPEYLFRYSVLEVFNTLKQCLNKVAQAKLYQLPVFYLIFDYQVPKDFSEDELKLTIAKMGKFTKYPPGGSINPMYLLDYVYVDHDRLPGDFPVVFTGTIDEIGGNQDYFDTMSIGDSPTELDGSGVDVGVLEDTGWYSGHSEFDPVDDQIEIIMNPNLTSEEKGELQSKLTESTFINLHGTRTLGLLKSPHNPGNAIDCKGLLPPNSKAILSSARGKIPDTNSSLIDAEFSLECAIANLLSDFCQKGKYSQVIALEMAKIHENEHYPYTIIPTIAQLVECAYQLSHLVVVPAGNTTFELTNERIDSLDPPMRDAYTQTKDHCLLVGAYRRMGNKYIVHPGTNWGKDHVVIFAQGEAVLTTAHINDRYELYADTSCAAAIISGVVALLQAYARSESPLNRALSPEEAIDILTSSKAAPVCKGTVEVGHIPHFGIAKQMVDDLVNNGGPGITFPFPKPNAPVQGPVART